MKQEVKIPAVGESINEVTIGQWLKKDGESVQMDDVLCEIESEKATLEVRSEADGVLKIMTPEGETVSIGHKIAEIDTDARPEKTATPVDSGKDQEKKEPAEQPDSAEKTVEQEAAEVKAEPAAERREESEGKTVKISPVAARLMKEAGFSKSDVEGSGPGGASPKPMWSEKWRCRPDRCLRRPLLNLQNLPGQNHHRQKRRKPKKSHRENGPRTG